MMRVCASFESSRLAIEFNGKYFTEIPSYCFLFSWHWRCNSSCSLRGLNRIPVRIVNGFDKEAQPLACVLSVSQLIAIFCNLFRDALRIDFGTLQSKA